MAKTTTLSFKDLRMYTKEDVFPTFQHSQRKEHHYEFKKKKGKSQMRKVLTSRKTSGLCDQ